MQFYVVSICMYLYVNLLFCYIIIQILSTYTRGTLIMYKYIRSTRTVKRLRNFGSDYANGVLNADIYSSTNY